MPRVDRWQVFGMAIDVEVNPGHPLLLEDAHYRPPFRSSGTLAIIARIDGQSRATPACEGDPDYAEAHLPRHHWPIAGTVLGMPLPMLGIHPCQS
jgi:hypothetical protein